MSELSALLTLTAVPGFGPAKINKILAQLSASQFISLSTTELQAIGLKTEQIKAITQPNSQYIDKAIKWQEQDNCHILTLFDQAYPQLLKEIHDPPPMLYLVGDVNILSNPQLAIVGSRNASQAGLANAYSLAQGLVEQGFSITSGLALGVDARAHQGALDCHGITIAVMATGVDLIYPKRHQFMAQEIVKNGLVLSENPLGSQPFAAAFPKRNRLISGLSLGTIVIEAALKSGSLITARTAMEQGREVFAVPGSINNPLADGCNTLIQQGAKLIRGTADIIEELEPLINWSKQQKNSHFDEEDKQLSLPLSQLLDNVGYEVTSIDDVAISSNIPIADATAGMVELEIEGCIVSVPGGYIKVRRA